MIAITRIISGGQTGADQAGLRAANQAGIPTGGWAPRGWLVEDRTGKRHIPNPNIRDFGLLECPEPEGEPTEPLWKWNVECYKARTRYNARDAAVTVWFELEKPSDNRGFLATRKAVWDATGTFVIVKRGLKGLPPDQFARNWGATLEGRIVNIAGNRESKSPGIGAWVEKYLLEVFQILKEGS